MKLEPAGRAAEDEPIRRRRRARLGVGFAKLPMRNHAGPLFGMDDPFALRNLCRYGAG